MDYGLYLLVGLLVIIALVFLLSGKRKADEPVAPPTSVTPPVPAAVPPASIPTVDPVVAAPVTVAPPVIEPAPAPEPIAPVAPVERAPFAHAPQPVPASPAAHESDDLLRLKGVGPKLNSLLLELGVTRFAQIADWTDTDIAAIDAKLGNFKGRPVRDQWVDQARYLASGDIAGFESKYGKL